MISKSASHLPYLTDSIQFTPIFRQNTKFYPAYDKLMVLMEQDSTVNCTRLYLVKDQQVLWRYLFPFLINSQVMPTSRDLLIANPLDSQIDIVSLSSRQVRMYHKHNYHTTSPRAIHIIYFPKSKLFCVVQLLAAKIKLTYYTFQGFNANSKSIGSYQFQTIISSVPLKVDNQSAIAWVQCAQQESISFGIAELDQNMELSHRNMTLHQPKELINVYLKGTSPLVPIWLNKNKELVLRVPILPQQGYIYQQTSRDYRVCILGPSEEQAQKTALRQCNSYFQGQLLDQKVFQTNYFQQLQNILLMADSKISVFGSPNMLIAYYDCYQDQLIAFQQLKRQKVATILTSNWCRGVFITKEQLQHKLEKGTVVYFSRPLKDIYLLMLLFINEDFDDDLLQEAIDLLI